MRRWCWRIVSAVVFGALVAWAMVATQPAESPALASLVPEGALLYIQSPDFHSLLEEWDKSTEKRTWLESDNYAGFSQSRLFGRLAQAQNEFAAAATVPTGTALLESVAGKRSCLALYDIGKLEFVYVTRMDGAAAESTPLWQARGKFEQRSEAGATFFFRQDSESKRVAAFAAKDGWLILGTREDLVAGVLDRLQGSGRGLSDEAWYATAVHEARGQPGDLRMVLNLQQIVPSPYFRSYWVQQNITEMKQYASAVSDLFRGPQVWSEQRVLVRKEANTAATSRDVAGLSALAPADVAFWSAQASPDVGTMLTTLRRDLLDPESAAMTHQAYAPPVAEVREAGSTADFETRIDEAPAVEMRTDPWAPLQGALAAGQPSGFLQVYSTGTTPDGAFVSTGRAMVVVGTRNWDSRVVEDAVTTALRSSLTAGSIGAGWEERSGKKGNYFAFDGSLALFMAVHGKNLFVANDSELLEQLLVNADKPPVSTGKSESGVTYAAVFEHSAHEQGSFRKLMGALDRTGNRGSEDNGGPPRQGETPAFFSGNMASFSHVNAAVSRESIEERDLGATVIQNVQYSWSR